MSDSIPPPSLPTLPAILQTLADLASTDPRQDPVASALRLRTAAQHLVSHADAISSEGWRVTLKRIREVVASEWGLSIDDLDTQARWEPLIGARYAVMALLRRYTGLPHAVIGSACSGGDADRSTRAGNRVRSRIETDPRFRTCWNRATTRLAETEQASQ